MTLDNLVKDDQIRLFELPPGMRINALQICGSELSAEKTLTFAIQSPSLLDIELLSLPLTERVSGVYPVAPLTIREQGGSLVLNVASGAVSGRLSVLVRYSVIGYYVNGPCGAFLF
ncbi:MULTISPECIES: hypothetical protein [Edwardsiella]|uniref:Uncharacterized protein n=2 Tax=Edwardsiella anguillarum TaxID=1821960 RepID=A0ABY8SKB7_9GAMM|nr:MULTISPECIES: hypothetical protein [Edwardsiella]AKR77683.2 hypothetical protein AAZ33_08425 [Edwardsiella sp. LADL05-105]KAB0589732.1 hypothetical protein F7P84_13495 [Edwardsiella anguillarum]UOU80778.1 hypothetical protein MUN71_09575 [Edwardsiella anguillarum]WHP85523.1 hypothetical protein MQ095_09035 [Edwardsiella anguillarum]WHP89305.1 hypothetical protein MQ088_09045 [Edwardsiella anguillarum]